MILKRVIGMVVTCGALLGCGPKDRLAGRSADSAAAAQARIAADEANLLGQIDWTMAADSAVSLAMLSHARRPQVRAFAIATIKAAHDLRLATAEVARKAGITPQLEPDELAGSDVPLTISLIDSGSKSTNVDGLYLRGVVSRNRLLASLASKKSNITNNDDLKSFFIKIAGDCRKRVAAVAALESKS